MLRHSDQGTWVFPALRFRKGLRFRIRDHNPALVLGSGEVRLFTCGSRGLVGVEIRSLTVGSPFGLPTTYGLATVTPHSACLREAAWVWRRNATNTFSLLRTKGCCCSGSPPHLVIKLLRADATPLSGRETKATNTSWGGGIEISIAPMVGSKPIFSFRSFRKNFLSLCLLAGIHERYFGELLHLVLLIFF